MSARDHVTKIQFYTIMRQDKKKQLISLINEKDNHLNLIKVLSDNNINTRREIEQTRTHLRELINQANSIKRRIEAKRFRITKISNELKTLLSSYCSHLEELYNEAEKECHLDWEYFENGDIVKFEDFIETFLDHRKDYYLYRIRADRLFKDLTMKCELPPCVVSPSESTD